MNEIEIVEVMERHRAILRGHFLLSSGRHSDVFVQKFRVLEHPRLAQKFGELVAGSFPEGFDVVASPAVGAVVLGFATALAGGARSIFAERVDDDLRFRRGFRIEPHERVLVVEDVITTGASARRVVELAHDAGGDVVGVGSLLDRGDKARATDIGVPMRALVHLEVESWDEGACPLCANDVPLEDPGSRRVSTTS